MSEYDIGKLQVLVIEHHGFMKRLLIGVLRRFGVETIHQACDHAEGYRLLTKTETDLVVTDWSPEVDCIQFLEDVRRSPETPNPFVPVIVVTAHTEMRHVRAARDAGVTEFLAKPLVPKLLYGRIRSIIERDRLFVNASNFFGPDRRRRRIPFEGGNRRQGGNINGPERRVDRHPFAGRERRQGLPGHVAPEQRRQR